MPTMYQRIEAQGSSILSTVTHQVVTGLLDELDLNTLMKDSIYILNSFTAYSQYDDGNGRITINKNRCDVNVSFILDKTQVPWPVESTRTNPALGVKPHLKGNQTPILFDEKAGVLMEYHTTPCALDMDFVLKFLNFDEAARAFDTIKAKYSSAAIGEPFDFSFAFPFSMANYAFLSEIFSRKTDYANKKLTDYVKDMRVSDMSFDVRRSELTDPKADQVLMVRVMQVNCPAQLTMDQTEPDAEHVDQLPDSYSVSFKFVVQFNRPTIIACHCPLAIDNSPLPERFFTNNLITSHNNPSLKWFFSDFMVHEYAARGQGGYNNAFGIVRIPEYDDWFYADNLYERYEYRPILTAHFTLDGPVTTIDLKQLGDVQLHSVVQTIIRETGNEVLDYGGLFTIGVYANNMRLDQEIVSIDENLVLTIRSDRKDVNYRIMVSETTSLKKTDPKWNRLLIKYRYFFPMTIERNIKHLIDNRYLYIAYDNSFLNLISQLSRRGQLKPILLKMVELGEDTNEIFSYTQNASQLADYLVYTQSKRTAYPSPFWNTNIPANDAAILKRYYEAEGGYYYLTSTDGKLLFGADGRYLMGYNELPELPLLLEGASIYGRSLFVAFIERCLIEGHIGLDEIPTQYLQYNESIYPYANTSGGLYGFNTPLRVIDYNAVPQ